MDIKEKMNELEIELDSIYREYGNNVPDHELERYGYIQGYLDALNEVLNKVKF